MATIGTNLRRLRVAKGKSQAGLAVDAGLSRAAYLAIEGGKVTPRVDSLMRIASALDVRLEELLVPVRDLKSVRFRAKKHMTTRPEIVAEVARWLDDYNDLERLVDKSVPFKFKKARAGIAHLRGPDKPIKAARLARDAVGLRPDELVRDICGLLEENGVKVFTACVASDRFFGLSVSEADQGPAVVVNTWDRISVERWIFTAAHELGHLLLHLDSFDIGQTDERKTEESEADAFAAEFLMPDDLFSKEWAEARGLGVVEAVFKLKRIFRVSYRTVLYRVASKARVPADAWKRFQGEYRLLTGKTLTRTEEPDGLLPAAFRVVRPVERSADEPERLLEHDFVEDRLSRLVRDAVEHEEITLSRGAEILRLSLDHMRRRANSWVG
jgi:Zn-dependent peptidase ImmA (M78 family)/DNA-binding XRE family transcriptional regulator